MNNKELLEMIKNQFNQGRMAIGSGACFVSDEHVEWLIQQAERVEKLELEINDWRDETIKWNKRFEESEESHLEVLELLENVLKQNKHYREALKEIARGRFSGASYKARQALEEEI